MRSLFAVVLVLLTTACVRRVTRPEPQPWSSRLPGMSRVMEAAAAQPWGVGLAQIPSTVIDVGDLQDVPYLSFANADVEINFYGDPEQPAGVELGTKSTVPEHREMLRTFLASLVSAGDKLRLAAAVEGRKDQFDGLTYELTPPGAPDAYGAWWVTLTHPVGLQASRASAQEMQEVVEEQQEVREVVRPSVAVRYAPIRVYPPHPTYHRRYYRSNFTRRTGVYVRAPALVFRFR